MCRASARPTDTRSRLFGLGKHRAATRWRCRPFFVVREKHRSVLGLNVAIRGFMPRRERPETRERDLGFRGAAAPWGFECRGPADLGVVASHEEKRRNQRQVPAALRSVAKSMLASYMLSTLGFTGYAGCCAGFAELRVAGELSVLVAMSRKGVTAHGSPSGPLQFDRLWKLSLAARFCFDQVLFSIDGLTIQMCFGYAIRSRSKLYCSAWTAASRSDALLLQGKP